MDQGEIKSKIVFREFDAGYAGIVLIATLKIHSAMSISKHEIGEGEDKIRMMESRKETLRKSILQSIIDPLVINLCK